MQEYSSDFITESIPKLVLKMALPSALSMLVMSVYNMVDMYFVTKIGTNAAAALSIALSFTNIIQALGLLFGHGSGNYISRMMGKNKIVQASHMASTAILISFLVGLCLSFVSFFYIDQMITLLGATNLLHFLTKEYLQVVLWSAPFMITSITINNQLRLEGKAAIGMVGMFFGALLNCILNPIFIFVFDLGLSGAAYATLISQAISFIVLILLANKHSHIHCSWKTITFNRVIFKELFTGGIPNFAREILIALSLIILNNILKIYNDVYIASFMIINKLITIGTYLIVGLGHGFQPICGVNYGANRNDRVLEAFKFTIKLSLIIGIIMEFIYLFANYKLVKFFSTSISVINLSSKLLRWHASTLPLIGYITITGMFLQNTHRFRLATLITTARQGYIFIPIVFLFNFLLSIKGVMLAQPITDILSFFLAYILSRKRIKQLHLFNNERMLQGGEI